MKIKNLLTILSVVVMVISCGPTDNRKSFSEVTEYNDYIIDNINLIDELYVTTLNEDKGREYCLSQCDSLIANSEKTIALLNNIQPFEGDSSLAMAAKDFCSYMAAIGKKDLPQFINLAMNPDVSIQDLAEINTDANKLDENYEIQMDKIEKVQSILAKKHNFKVE